MSPANSSRTPLPSDFPVEQSVSGTTSLAIGYVIDIAGVVCAAAWQHEAPWLRTFLPFAAGHAVGAALIAYRASHGGKALNVGDHFFLRFGALVMALATVLLRTIV